MNFEDKFKELEKSVLGTQKRVVLNSAISVYYGLNSNGNFRLAFLSKIKPPVFESTKVLKVNQGIENNKYYWTSIDLINEDAKQVFYVLCNDLTNSIANIGEELEELNILHSRYRSWAKMFSRDVSKLSEELIKGLLGELYFLKEYMFDKYSMEDSINAWSGPSGTSKDFSINNAWYEIKTVSIGKESVKISSIYQLDSIYPGKLAIISIEKMSDEYDDGKSCVKDLFQSILSLIKDNDLKDVFINKVISYGFDYDDKNILMKFAIKDISLYLVNEKFPRITESKIPIKDISKISYDLIIRNLIEYKVDEL